MSEPYPIEAVGLCKQFGNFTALDGLDLQVKRNSFTGLLGPNGAGKSTTLKIFCHLHKSTSGNAYINGYDV
ncbi:MAG: ATP-binding cassette domain-containing protein [Candidatus Methanomethylophilaceae archaeon]|nr:ATP-binding cassette domain-containing protein [Candidatus Methanomethylophilaceae archaeon]